MLKSAFKFVFGYGEQKKAQQKKSKSPRQIAKRTILFLSTTANRKIALKKCFRFAQPASQRLLRKTAIYTQMLRQRNSATAK